MLYLQETSSETVFVDRFEDVNTLHCFRVIRLWEQNPALLLVSPGLLPFATLAKTVSPAALLKQVADKVEAIASPDQQRNVSACAQLLAGLKYDDRFIRAFLRKELMQESTVYQEIIRRGIQQGRQEGESIVISRQLMRKFGGLPAALQARLQQLSIEQLEELAEGLFDFSTIQDLVNWLDAHS